VIDVGDGALPPWEHHVNCLDPGHLRGNNRNQTEIIHNIAVRTLIVALDGPRFASNPAMEVREASRSSTAP
jgi:hypothetical protein